MKRLLDTLLSVKRERPLYIKSESRKILPTRADARSFLPTVSVMCIRCQTDRQRFMKEFLRKRIDNKKNFIHVGEQKLIISNGQFDNLQERMEESIHSLKKLINSMPAKYRTAIIGLVE